MVLLHSYCQGTAPHMHRGSGRRKARLVRGPAALAFGAPPPPRSRIAPAAPPIRIQNRDSRGRTPRKHSKRGDDARDRNREKCFGIGRSKKTPSAGAMRDRGGGGAPKASATGPRTCRLRFFRATGAARIFFRISIAREHFDGGTFRRPFTTQYTVTEAVHGSDVFPEVVPGGVVVSLNDARRVSARGEALKVGRTAGPAPYVVGARQVDIRSLPPVPDAPRSSFPSSVCKVRIFPHLWKSC